LLRAIRFRVAERPAEHRSEFQRKAVYGWRFIDVVVDESRAPSLDISMGVDGLSHSLYLFQGDTDRVGRARSVAGYPGELNRR
jgi:hypothetical protein